MESKGSREDTGATQYLSVTPILQYSKIVMRAFADCGMHLIFHGIVAYCVKVMKSIQ